MNKRTFSLGAFAALTVFLAGFAAPQEASAEVLFQYAVGAKGGMNLNMLSGPPEKPVDPPIPGFSVSLAVEVWP